jgi:hypothetical protein
MRPYSTRLALVLAAAVTLAAACGDDDDTTLPPGFENDTCVCVALGVDYMNGVGVATAVGIPSLHTQTNFAAGGVSGDPVLRYQDGKFYVVNRVISTVTIIDAATLAVDDQFVVGTSGSSNANDLAVNGREAWVVYLGDPQVKVFDLDDTAAEPASIALPTIAADADGNPDAASIAIVDGKAYVTLEHLESFAPAANGQIVVIDVGTRAVVTTIDLPEKNPVNFLSRHGSSLYVAALPDYSDPTLGCLVEISTGATPTAACVASAEGLGGYVNAVAPAADGTLYVATAQSFTESEIVSVGTDGAIDATPLSAAGQQPTDLTACGKYVIANDGAVGGLRVYDAEAKTELTTDAIDLGEPAAFASGVACFSK